MPNIKPQAIHPAVDTPYADGILALAAVDIEENQLVTPSQEFSAGPQMKTHVLVRPIGVASVKLAVSGPWWVAKHSASAGEYVVVLPWKVVPIEGAIIGSAVKLDLGTAKAVPADYTTVYGEDPTWIVGQAISPTKALVTNTLQFGQTSGRRWTPINITHTPAPGDTQFRLRYQWRLGPPAYDILQVGLSRDDSGGPLGAFVRKEFTVEGGPPGILVEWANPATNGDAQIEIVVSQVAWSPA